MIEKTKDFSKITGKINQAKGIVNFSYTNENGYVMVLPNNECFYKNIPADMDGWLKEYKKTKKKIVDVNITEGGRWTIVTDDGFAASEKFPESCDVAEECLRNGEKLKSYSINDNGDWAIVTDRQFYGRSDLLSGEIIGAAIDEYGPIQYIYLGNGYALITCERGLRYESPSVAPPEGVFKNLEFLEPPLKVAKIFTDYGYLLVSENKKGPLILNYPASE